MITVPMVTVIKTMVMSAVAIRLHGVTAMQCNAMCDSCTAGFDRLMAVLCQATSLKDVVAFPKSFYGRCLLTGAPSDLRPSDLTRYHFQQGLDWKP